MAYVQHKEVCCIPVWTARAVAWYLYAGFMI